MLNRKRAEALMEQAGVEAVVASTPYNVLYTSGFWSLGQWALPGTQVYVVLHKDALDKPRLILPHGELDLVVEQQLTGLQPETYGTFYCNVSSPKLQESRDRQLGVLASPTEGRASALEALVHVLEDLRLTEGSIAVDERGLSFGFLEVLRSKLPKARIEVGHDLLIRIRMVKTEREIDVLRRAAQICERAVYGCLAKARPGITERQMARRFEEILVQESAKPLLLVVAFGAHSAFPNAIPSDRTLEQGDLIRFDVGCTYQGYTSDIARIAVLGQPGAKVSQYYGAILAGEDAALACVRGGMPVRDVFEAAVKAVRGAGIPHYKRHHVGHGVGIEVYDPPLIAPGDATVLEPGMVIDVETPYYELGFAGLQIEDTVVVRKDGFERLTASPKDIITVPDWV